MRLSAVTILPWLIVSVVRTQHESDELMRFSVDLFQELLKNSPETNFVLCPISISTLMAMIQQGAGGNTLDQLSKVLHAEPEHTRKLYSRHIRNLKKLTNENNSSVIIEFATKTFINGEFHVNPLFKGILKRDFFTDIEIIDASKGPIAAAKINDWVQKQTHGKIKEIFSPDNMDSNMRMLLVNAVFFHGSWEYSFKVEDTYDSEFFVEPDRSIMVPTMHRTSYAQALDDKLYSCKWIKIPFQGRQFTMLIILPNIDVKAKDILTKMQEDNGLIGIIKNKRKRRVNLAIPKFKIESRLKVISTMQKLGITDVFDPKYSDLKGISDLDLFVSQAVHKTQLGIDEQGGLAASASGMAMKMRSAHNPMIEPLDIIVDRPFLVFIVDDMAEIPLFAGRIVDPSKS